MRQLSLKIEYFDRSSTCIGRVKEDNSTEVIIDITYWLEKFPNLTIEGIYSRPDGQNYPVVLTQGESSVNWIVKRKDLYKCGTGKITLNGYQDEQSVISATGLVYVLPGIGGEMVDDNPDDPSTIPAEWIDDILKASAEAKEAAALVKQYLGNIKINFSFASGATTATYTNAAITPNHVIVSIMYTMGKEYMTGDITWKTSNGSITLTFPATIGEVTGSLVLIYAV